MGKKATTWRQAQKQARRKEAPKKSDSHSDFCTECLRRIANEGELVGAEVFESAGETFEVWLTTGQQNESCKVLGLTESTGCFLQAELIADAVRGFLNTPDGQRQAVQYIKHRVNEFHGKAA